ncbi:MAG: TolC family protein [Crocinitomicaceae bacterium]|nr:TolC family protein [Crocinitomicaceae bacterium]
MKTKINVLATLFLSLIAQLAISQEVKLLTLEEAKEYTLDHHIAIVNAEHDVDFAQQQIIETRGMGLPQVEITGQFSHFINIPVSVVDATLFNPSAPAGSQMEFQMGTEYSTTGTLQANQMLFNGIYIVGLKASKLFKSLQMMSTETTKEELVFNTIQAYQLAVIARENMTFSDSIVALTERMVDDQKHFLEVGAILQEDMDQLSYSLLTAMDVAATAKMQYQNAISLLKYSMGYPMDETIEVAETSEILLGKRSLSAGSIQDNLTLAMMQKKVELSVYGIKQHKVAHLPSLYAFFSHSYNAYRSEFNFFADEKWYPQTVWGLQLSIPIFSGLQRHARVEQAKITYMKDQNDLKRLERALQLQEIQFKNNLTGALNKYELLKENIALAESIYENAATKKEIGKANGMLVTQKQNQLLIAQAQYLGSLMDLFQAQLDMDKLYNKLLSK